ncbi:unnamed protein product [Euphydryas editha]|uniref:Uncharacterized protein n=1 Tax=Euphydryas editha TaxID=104508 RepID=A0AAU9UV75_EUPED|nr:unnamed protein product [Euphydryas editha]
MKVLQLNLNKCVAAHDLLMQTVRKLIPNVMLISEPYRNPAVQNWETDRTVKMVIWSLRIPFWADTLKMQESRRPIVPVYRRSALKVTSAFRMVSKDAACVIEGMLPIAMLAEERQAPHWRKKRLRCILKNSKLKNRKTVFVDSK